MSILFMEGFEDVKGPADLQARGEFGTAGQLGPGAARYAGGNAIVRGSMQNAQLFGRAVAQPQGDGVYHSFQGYFSSSNGNFAAGTRVFGPWYVNGQWLASIASSSTLLFKSSDGVNWEVFATNSTTNQFQGICWDPNRGRYIGIANSNNSTTGTWWTSLDLVTWTVGGNLSQTNSQQTWGIQFIPSTGHIIFASQNYVWRLAAGQGAAAMIFQASITRPTRIVSDGAARVFIIDSTGAIRRSTDGGTTFEVAGTARGASSQYLSWLDDKLYIGSNLGIDYSTDNGSTFVQTTNATTPQGVMLVTRLGTTFYARSAQTSVANDMWTSSDGVTWSLKPDPLMSNPIGYTTGIEFVNLNDRLYFLSAGASAPITSSDGEFWSYVPCTGITNTTPPKTVMNGMYMTSPLIPNQWGTYFGSGGAIVVLNPTGSVSTTTTIPQKDKWYLTEYGITRVGPNTYQTSVSFDGTEIWNNTYTLNDYQGYTTSGTASMQPWVSNGTTVLLSTGTTIGTISPASSGIASYTSGSGISMNNAVWTGRNFIAISSNTIHITNDPATNAAWRLTNTLASSNLIPADVREYVQDGANMATVIVGNSSSSAVNAGRILRSTDHGETWTSMVLPDWPAGAGITKVMYLNGLWMITGSASGVPWYYSSDDGLTWQQDLSMTLYSGYSANHSQVRAYGKMYASFMDPAVDNIIRLYEVSVNGTTISANQVAAVSWTTSNVRYMAFNGKTLVIPAYANSGLLWVTEDGNSWSQVTMVNAVPTNPTGISWFAGGSFFICSGQASGHRLFAPTFLDFPMSTTLDSRSWSAYDDILVTDNVLPFAGPQGEARLMKVPLDQTVTAEWSPTPSSLTNLQAATAQTVGISKSYIESNAVGQEDVYGTSSFSVPPGYRAAAVQVEGYYSRTLNSIPTARFGVRSGSSNDTTSPVDVSAAIGQKVYVSKIVQQDPATGAAWTTAGVANSKITNERTS